MTRDRSTDLCGTYVSTLFDFVFPFSSPSRCLVWREKGGGGREEVIYPGMELAVGGHTSSGPKPGSRFILEPIALTDFLHLEQ